LVLFGAAAVLRAHVLAVCNKGTVPVMVVTAMKNADIARGLGKYYWATRSTAVASGKCEEVYSDMDGDGAYLAFTFEDAKGQWGSGKVAQVPDFGIYVQCFQDWPILSRGKGTIDVCTPRVDATYRVNDDPKTDCATMRLTRRMALRKSTARSFRSLPLCTSRRWTSRALATWEREELAIMT
jgi:hypothetical protein